MAKPAFCSGLLEETAKHILLQGKLEEEKAGRGMWLLQEKNRKSGERIPLQEKSGRGKFRKMGSAS